MPSRFEQYRMFNRGAGNAGTPLNAETLNRIWEDIDTRLVAAEEGGHALATETNAALADGLARITQLAQALSGGSVPLNGTAGQALFWSGASWLWRAIAIGDVTALQAALDTLTAGVAARYTSAQVDTIIAALTKTSVGLANVDNVADASKPVSTAQAAAIAAAQAAAIAAIPALAAAADIWVGTNNTKPLTAKALADALAPVTITYGSTITPDLTTFINGQITATGNFTLANPSAGMKPGYSGYILIKQDGTGSRLLSAVGSWWKFNNNGARTLSTGANAEDKLSYSVHSSTRIYAELSNTYA